MKKLLAFLCVLLLLVSCEKDDQPKRELIISADGILPGGTHVQFGGAGGISNPGYSVYLHKGEIEITDKILINPVINSYISSRGIFFKVIDEGVYTVIVDVYYTHDGAFGNSYYSGVAHTTVKYPSPDLNKTFTFDWNKGISTYEENDITYINLRPPYPTD